MRTAVKTILSICLAGVQGNNNNMVSLQQWTVLLGNAIVDGGRFLVKHKIGDTVLAAALGVRARL